LRHRVEADLLFALPHLYDGCDELDKEIRDAQQRGVRVIEEIDEETFDVRAVVILPSAKPSQPSHSPDRS
jgi:hypothetical protein